MFDIGFQELIIIFAVALIVFGPKQLPEIARTLGRSLGGIKRSFEGVKEQMNAEMKEIEKETKISVLDGEAHRNKSNCGDSAGKSGPAADGKEIRKEES